LCERRRLKPDKSTALKNRYSTKADPPPFRIEEAAVETLNGKSVDHWPCQRLSTLTALEARVISVMLNQCTIDDKTLLKVVADETHVSNAMLVKIAKKLGFDGFRSLRAALAKQNRRPLAKARQELGDEPTVRALADKARGLPSKHSRRLSRSFHSRAWRRAAQWLEAARQRDFYGLGALPKWLGIAACKFLRIGLRASVFDDGLMMLMSASLLPEMANTRGGSEKSLKAERFYGREII
jgi:DNA-binding MurR/RpiR family transcriptional regulator